MFYGYVLLYARNRQNAGLGFEGLVQGRRFGVESWQVLFDTPLVHMEKGRKLEGTRHSFGESARFRIRKQGAFSNQ